MDADGPVDALTRRASNWMVWAAVALPLIVAAVVLLTRPWAPVLDMAMTELRVRDVGGRHTPLVGLPGRIGTFPDQGSHPGPWSFYLVAPFYRLSGSRAWGLELGSIVLNSAAVAAIVATGKRLFGPTGAVAFAAIAAVAVRGYGLGVLTHPWNPYFPVVIWLLVLLAAWAVLLGHDWFAVTVVVCSSIAAQTHVPYLVSAVALDALVLGMLVWRRLVTEPRHHFIPDFSQGPRPPTPRLLRPLEISIVAGVVMWVPPLLDQFAHDPGNLRRLLTHFATDQPEPAIGTAEAARVFFRHLDPSVVVGLVRYGDAFLERSGSTGSSWVGGMVVFAAWIASALIAWRRAHHPLVALHTVIAVALAAGAFSISRIFGKVWFYLTLWAWGTTLLVGLSIAWTLVLLWRERGRAPSNGALVATAGVVLGTVTGLSTVAAFGLDPPESQISDGLRAVVPATVAALDAGSGEAIGHDGRYLVFWQDAAYSGSPGYGLVNELERRGFRVGVHPTWRVPVTAHRVVTAGGYDAEVHLVTGAYIDVWRERDGYTEVIEVDTRTPDERANYDALRTTVLGRLAELGRSDLIEGVDLNLFGVSLDPDLPRDVVDAMSEMLLLSVPFAVFIAPAGSTS